MFRKTNILAAVMMTTIIALNTQAFAQYTQGCQSGQCSSNVSVKQSYSYSYSYKGTQQTQPVQVVPVVSLAPVVPAAPAAKTVIRQRSFQLFPLRSQRYYYKGVN